VGGALLSLCALALVPSWPRDWLASAGHSPVHLAPIRVLGGGLCLLALTRWRRPEARLLVAMACVPQSLLYYDQLPLWLVPRSWRESAALTLLSHVATFVVWWFQPLPVRDLLRVSGPVIVALLYLPALLMVMRRRNEGEVAPWVERLANGVRRPLRHLLPAPRAAR
jgi:hypothetical protein